ncbi:MAG: saccharopine dehydrogenase C-terminal domain-containing protein [Candidatus Undinarchaeales archaeon]|nr:saccharopine dehydrogenase C-terminal domain-containing protein [Candidatus Undinarchaeales archaeon]
MAPGMSNMIPGYVDSILDKTTDLTIMVGGLPKERSWPYEYKAPFSPIDVLEEYTRPARLVRDGKVVVLPALSEPELVDFPDIGTLEAFNTDGLRSLITTIDAPNMKEKTMRYPGHIELMRVLRETGFFSQEKIELKNGTQVKPLDLTTRLLFPMWKLGPEDREFTVMRVEVAGLKNDKQVTYTYDLMDRYDEDTGFSSMSRTTGFPAAIVARQVLAGRVTDKGVFPPEFLGRDHELFQLVLAELTKRGVVFTERIE